VPNSSALHVTLALRAEAASVARRDLRALGLGPTELATTALLTSELVTNSVRHAGPLPMGGVELHVAVNEESVRVEVLDGGPGFTPAGRAPGSPQDACWGLHLVEEMADRWGVKADAPHTLVWFELDRAQPSAAT
jgi:serine/threonine-protein kinase RsbW